MTTLAVWYLITVWSSGVSTLPMHDQAACMKAREAHGDFCYNTNTGEVVPK